MCTGRDHKLSRLCLPSIIDINSNSTHPLRPTREVPLRADQSMRVQNAVYYRPLDDICADHCVVHRVRVFSPCCLGHGFPRMAESFQRKFVNESLNLRQHTEVNTSRTKTRDFIDKSGDQRSFCLKWKTLLFVSFSFTSRI